MYVHPLILCAIVAIIGALLHIIGGQYTRLTEERKRAHTEARQELEKDVEKMLENRYQEIAKQGFAWGIEYSTTGAVAGKTLKTGRKRDATQVWY